MRTKNSLLITSLFNLLLILFPLLSPAQISYNMYLVAHLNEHSGVYAIGCWGYVQNGREYAIIGCQTGTAFIDVTDSANIHEVDFLTETNSNWRDCKVYSHYAYLTADVAGSFLKIVDLQYLPDSIHYVGSYSHSGFSRAHTIQQSGPYLYVNGGNYSAGGVFVLDLTVNPEVPIRRGQWEIQYIHDERVLNDTLWACNIYSGNITVINAVNKDSLQTVTSWLNGSGPSPHNCAITTDRRYLLATDEILNPVGRLKVWNIENLNNITHVATWFPAGGDSSNVHNVEIYGNYALICHYTAGIRVLDISNPPTPVEVAWYDTYPQNNGNTWNGCKGIYMMPSGLIIANDRETGFYAVRTTFPIGINNNNNSVPEKFSLKQNYPNPFNPITNIEFSIPKNAYVSLKVYDVLGKEIITLFNGYTRAGNNRITYDAENLSSGVYFYTLISERFSDTKKMVLMK